MEIQKEQVSTAVQHIDTIIADIQQHIDKEQDFVGFILVALGVEFIGSFFDSKEFDEYGQSENRFKNGMRLFKEDWYKTRLDWMFKEFRGPLIHQYRTGDKILLTSYCKNKTSLKEHFVVKEGKTVFVLERLFEGFKEASDSFKNLARKQNSLDMKKVNQNYIGIRIITTTNSEQTHSYSVSGTTETPRDIKNLDLYTYQPSKKGRKKK